MAVEAAPLDRRGASSVSELADRQRFRLGLVVGGLVLAALVLGPLAGVLAMAGRGVAVIFIAALLVPLLFWKVPTSPVVVMVLAATNVERFPDPGADNLTAKVPLFRSLADIGLSGTIVLPIELIIGLALLVWIARAIAERKVSLRSSHLGAGVGLLLLAALVTELHGLARGAVFNISLWELRPFLYLGGAYLLASQLMGSRAALMAILWGIVIGTGLKGVLGTERTITTAGVYPRPEAILEHDEAVFMDLYILVTAALWVFGHRGRLRQLASMLLPFVLTADLGNNRRAAWVILPAIMVLLTVVAYHRMPERRKLIAGIAVSLALVGSAYVFAFRNNTSLIGSPAHAIWSQFHPDPRDAASNLYRTLENMNLGLDIKGSPLIGTGFGVPIAHPIPVFDATEVDPLINFIPHNNVLYVWMRMGTPGHIIFWWMVGAAVVAACHVARLRDAQLSLIGVVTLCAITAWCIEGWLDKGLVSFRVVILIGCLLGAVEAARRLAASEASRAPDAAVADPGAPHANREAGRLAPDVSRR